MSTVITTGICLGNKTFMKKHEKDAISMDCLHLYQLPNETGVLVIPVALMRKPKPKRSNNTSKVR